MNAAGPARRVAAAEDTRPPDAGARREAWLAAQGARPAPWLVLYALLLAVQVGPWWYPAPDATVYLSIARGLARTGTLAAFGNPQIGYPPGFPLLIAPAFAFGERPFLALSILQWLMSVALMLGVYRWTRRRWPDAALLLTGLAMVNVGLWMHLRRALSEVAFAAALVWAAEALDGALASGARRAARAAVGAAALLAAAMIREAALALAVGLALAAAMEVRRARMRAPAALALVGLVTLPAAAAVAAFTFHDVAMKQISPAPLGTHVDGLVLDPTPLLPRLVEGLRLRISEAGAIVVPGMFSAYSDAGEWLAANVLVYIALCAALALGWWRLVRRQHDVLALSLPAYLAIYVAWPFGGGTRYVLPVLPVLLACLWLLVEPWRRGRLQVLAGLLVAHLGVATGHWLIKDLPSARACHAEWPAMVQLAEAADPAAPLVVSDALPVCLRYMLTVARDRRVGQQSASADRPASAWVVIGPAEPPWTGLEERARAGGYRLLAPRS